MSTAFAIRLFEPAEIVSDQLPGDLRLRAYYLAYVLPELQDEELSPRSIGEDKTAIGHWERTTGDPPINQADVEHVRTLRDRLKEEGYAAATINKIWREISSMLRFAVEEGDIVKIPILGRRQRKKLVKEPPKVQREMIIPSEIDRLWIACEKATYPNRTNAVRMWRVAIVLFYTYGARTLDMFLKLRRENVRFQDGLLRFEAMKTKKLQGLPLTPIVAAQLETICEGLAPHERIFEGFNRTGCWWRKRNKWESGFRTTWRREILPAAGLDGLSFKHFRETVVTRYNGLEPGLGSWIAAHYMPGVSAQHYDNPTKRIRDAIESAPVPDCFHDLS